MEPLRVEAQDAVKHSVEIYRDRIGGLPIKTELEVSYKAPFITNTCTDAGSAG
jgi:hypothetical protein